MEEPAPSIQLDPLLQSFVEADGEAMARARMEELLVLVTPSIKMIVSRSDFPDDGYQESSEQIIRALWQCRADPQKHAIGDFQRYVTVVAAHVRGRQWRAKHPAFHALKASLRHTLRNDSRLAMWEGTDCELLCGMAQQCDHSTAKVSSTRLAQLLQNPLEYDEAILPERDAQNVPQAELLAGVFTWLGHAVSFEELVKIVFALRRIEEAVPLVDDDDDDSRPLSETLSGTGPLPDEESQWKEFLELLWTEIEQLPPLQRIAYLLNFTAGEGALEIFWLYGVAAVHRIGATVRLTDEQFTVVWNELALNEKVRHQAAQLTDYDAKFALLWRYLPLNDLTIARLIGTERQKVINLRKAAGDRLARRLAAFRRLS